MRQQYCSVGNELLAQPRSLLSRLRTTGAPENPQEEGRNLWSQTLALLLQALVLTLAVTITLVTVALTITGRIPSRYRRNTVLVSRISNAEPQGPLGRAAYMGSDLRKLLRAPEHVLLGLRQVVRHLACDKAHEKVAGREDGERVRVLRLRHTTHSRHTAQSGNAQITTRHRRPWFTTDLPGAPGSLTAERSAGVPHGPLEPHHGCGSSNRGYTAGKPEAKGGLNSVLIAERRTRSVVQASLMSRSSPIMVLAWLPRMAPVRAWMAAEARARSGCAACHRWNSSSTAAAFCSAMPEAHEKEPRRTDSESRRIALKQGGITLLF